MNYPFKLFKFVAAAAAAAAAAATTTRLRRELPQQLMRMDPTTEHGWVSTESVKKETSDSQKLR
jgi:hypothetical protein